MPLNRNCRNLQYLSVAYCNRVTDEGFLCLAQETVCNNLIYLDLSGCTQVSGGPLLGFRLLSLRSLGLPSKNPRAPLARGSARSWLRTVAAGSRRADCEEGRREADSDKRWVWFTQPPPGPPTFAMCTLHNRAPRQKTFCWWGGGGSSGLDGFQMCGFTFWSAETMKRQIKRPQEGDSYIPMCFLHLLPPDDRKRVHLHFGWLSFAQ